MSWLSELMLGELEKRGIVDKNPEMSETEDWKKGDSGAFLIDDTLIVSAPKKVTPAVQKNKNYTAIIVIATVIILGVIIYLTRK